MKYNSFTLNNHPLCETTLWFYFQEGNPILSNNDFLTVSTFCEASQNFVTNLETCPVK